MLHNLNFNGSDYIIGVWMWGSTIADAGENGAETVMSKCAEMGITDVYLLVKGTGGKLGYLNTAYSDNLVRKERDILSEAICAAHSRNIRLHAWICNMEDSAYKAAHPDAGMWHYLRGRDSDKINLYDEGYRAYMSNVAHELASYDIDGLHLDYIRYNHITNGWSERDISALKAMGMDIERAKELIETTFGYHGRTADSRYIFDAYRQGDETARLIALYRRNNVKEYAKTLISAAKSVKPSLTVSAATMPEGAYDQAFADLHYGQNYRDAAELYDYICPMSYSTSYGKDEFWVEEISKNAADMGNKVVTGLQAFDNATPERVTAEKNGIFRIMKTEEYSEKILGINLFRFGTLK